MSIRYSDWYGCYKRGWGGVLTPAAFQHPAKVSLGLAERIYDYLLENKMVKEGDTVLDPFGGIAGFGYSAMYRGLHFIGCELEDKFVALGNQNIALWNARYAGKMPRWGSARLVQGDSRHLRDVIAQASAAVSSPPYAATDLNGKRPNMISNLQGKLESGKLTGRESIRLAKLGKLSPHEMSNLEGYSRSPANLGNLPEGDYRAAISSPPYADGCAHTGGDDPHPEHIQGGEYHGVGINAAVSSPPYEEARIGQESGQEHCGHNDAYGGTPGQMGAMKSGGFAGAISSPPYADQAIEKNSKSVDRAKQYEAYRAQGGGASFEAFCKTQDLHSQGYGTTEGQLSAMRGNGYDAAVSSPPYEAALSSEKNGIDWTKAKKDYPGRQMHAGRVEMMNHNHNERRYSPSHENMGNERGDNFWLAARQVVAETYAVLAPGAVAVFVVKDFIRNKARVPFCDQWRQLCEACGFSTYAIARAWLVEDHGTQLAMDGNHKRKRTERKSFFRRLAERKGSPRIDFETVLIMRKPEAAA